MQRSKLEVASWIAGVAGAVIALVALIAQLRQSPGDQPTSEARLRESVAASSPADRANAVTEEPLRAAYEAAKAQSNVTDRESSLLAVSRSAVKRNDFDLVLDIAASLSIYRNRDKLYAIAACHLAYRGRYASAREAAKKISVHIARDESLRHIASVAQTEPGQGENEYSCGEA